MDATANEPKFKIGDTVDMTNGYGVVFPGKIIIAVIIDEDRGITYSIEPTDTPWYSVREENLRKQDER